MLPKAIVEYYTPTSWGISGLDADTYFKKFLSFDWKRRYTREPDPHKISKYKNNRETIVFGNIDNEKDLNSIIPKLWGMDIEVQKWTPELLEIKNKISTITGKEYNICLCNLYRTRKRSIGFHSDREEFGSISSIASVSLGLERDFVFRDKENGEKYTIILEHGSLLIMGDGCQENYEHSIPPIKNDKLDTEKSTEIRINLTFRLFDKERYTKY